MIHIGQQYYGNLIDLTELSLFNQNDSRMLVLYILQFQLLRVLLTSLVFT